MSGGRGISFKKKIQSKSQKAGLIFPVARFHRYLKKQFSTSSQFKISSGAAVYAASVLEYLVAEITEQAGNASKVMKVKRITPRHIMLAIHQDMEMKQALSHVILPSSGRPLDLKFVSKPAPKKKALTQKTPRKSQVSIKNTKKKSVLKKASNKSKKAVKASKNVHWSNTKKSLKASVKRNTSGKSDDGRQLNQRTFFQGQVLSVVRGNIANIKADAAVHPCNGNYHFGGQVGNAMMRKGGTKLEDEVRKTRAITPHIRDCEALMSGAANMPYNNIIHVNSPSWTDDTNVAIGNLEKTVRNILTIAENNKLNSLAIPSISSGGGGYPKQVAAETILRTINCYYAGIPKSDIKKIIFVIYDKETLDVYNAELKRLA